MSEEKRGGRSGQNNRGNRNDNNGGGRNGGGKNGGGRKRNRNRGRDKKSNHPGKPFTGMLEMIGDKNFGFIRSIDPSLPKGDNDPFMPPPIIDKYNLRDGVTLEGTIKPGRKGAWQVTDLDTVMGVSPEEWKECPSYDEGVTIYPNEKLQLVSEPTDVSMRVIDLVAPLGKGQRALIVAPPRTGKTVLLKKLARALEENHPEVELVALLVDERPEEVTDFKRTTKCQVFASSNDFEEDNHVRVATLAYEYSRRLVEQGKDVVILLDSLTRLGRTFNLWGGNSGRTMSGGLDARALVMPRKIFGAARNIEHGGSLTIIATALIETGSRMDDVIFEEFKGTGNAEIVLDRELADKRIFPAINLRKSGTRNEERLLGEMTKYHHMLMRALNSRHPVEAMQALIRHIQMSPDNIHLLNELIPAEM
jgi:transcription termination factor Rho